jgi:hypothetical protein
MAYTTFNDALMQAKRASALRGLPFGTADVQNLRSGYMEGAAERAAGERSSALADRSFAAQQKNWEDSLAQEKENTRMQMEAADTASGNALKGNIIGTGASLAGAYYLARPAVTAAGAQLAGTASTNAPLATIGTESAYTGGTSAGGVGSGATLGAYTGVGAAGFAGGKVGGAVGRPVGEAIGVGGERERSIFGGAVGGAAAGAAAGTYIWPAVGTVAGGVIGGVVGAAEEAFCIIVTACTERNSPEVEITREYRDKFLDADQLRGYYMIAEKIVPILERNKTVRLIVKRLLVDRLVDYGKVALGYRTQTLLTGSQLVSCLFLMLCRVVGKSQKRFVRSNMEVF